MAYYLGNITHLFTGYEDNSKFIIPRDTNYFSQFWPFSPLSTPLFLLNRTFKTQLLLTSKFPGLISRCNTLAEWRYFNPKKERKFNICLITTICLITWSGYIAYTFCTCSLKNYQIEDLQTDIYLFKKGTNLRATKSYFLKMLYWKKNRKQISQTTDYCISFDFYNKEKKYWWTFVTRSGVIMIMNSIYIYVWRG